MKKVIELVTVRILKKFGVDPVKNIQALCPTHRGGYGAISLNATLHEALNQSLGHGVTKHGQRYAAGGKIMQTGNNYVKQLYNDDIGIIKTMNIYV